MHRVLFSCNYQKNVFLRLLLLVLAMGRLVTQAQAYQSSQLKIAQVANAPNVIFPNNMTASLSSWTPTEINTQVPLNTVDGGVMVTAVQGNSNTVPFSLGDSSVPNASGQAGTWTTEFDGGTIATDTIWDENILIKGDVTITNSTTLTITPGVTVFFTAGSDAQASGDFTDKVEIIAHGTLIAEGTQANPIYFTSNSNNPAPQDWGHIKLLFDSHISMSHSMVRYADKGVNFYRYASDSVGGGVIDGTVKNSLFSDNRMGIHMRTSPSYPGCSLITINPTIANNHFQNNVEYGIKLINASGCGNSVNTMIIQNNVIMGSDIGFYLLVGTWWLGHADVYPSLLNNTIRDNNTAGISFLVDGSSDGSGSDSDAQPIIKHNLLENNGSNIHLILNPMGSDGFQNLKPTIQYNSILNAKSGILIDDTEGYDTLEPTIQNNVFFGYEGAGTYAINNQTGRSITAPDNYWGSTAAAWDVGPQAGDTNGTVFVNSFLNSSDNPIFTRLTPGQAEVGTEVKLYGANFGPQVATCATQTEIPQAECETLVAIYNSTDGPNWTNNNNWLDYNSPCSWSGVDCSGGRVDALELDNKQLSGSLPDISAFTGINKIDLTNNQLSGSIPNLSALTNLAYLFLENNQFSGTIPNLAPLIEMRVLNLSNNKLNGPIPSLSTLTQLNVLILNSNHLTGQIPDLSNLVDLWHLDLNNNKLDGTLPDFSPNINLQTIYLANNQFSGNVPTSICQLQNVYIGYNKLEVDSADSCVDTATPDWKQSQTVPPTNLAITPISATKIELTWDIIEYTNHGGYYGIWGKKQSDAAYTLMTTTADKTVNRATISGLQAETAYEFMIRTFTPAHGYQQNDLTSVESEVVSAITLTDVPKTYSIFLPIIISPIQFEPITINGTTIPVRDVTTTGEVFYTTAVDVVADIPSSGKFYLSSSASSPVAASVDDELAILLNGVELFTYTYGQPGSGVQPALVEVPHSVMTQIAGETITIQFRDVFGENVYATEMYLIWVP